VPETQSWWPDQLLCTSCADDEIVGSDPPRSSLSNVAEHQDRVAKLPVKVQGRIFGTHTNIRQPQVPIQFGWSFLSDGEKRFIAGIAKATYTARVQAGKSVIKITTSQSAAVATNAIGSSLVNGSDLFWVVLFLASYADAGYRPNRVE
jgi:hypothetical protein